MPEDTNPIIQPTMATMPRSDQTVPSQAQSRTSSQDTVLANFEREIQARHRSSSVEHPKEIGDQVASRHGVNTTTSDSEEQVRWLGSQ